MRTGNGAVLRGVTLTVLLGFAVDANWLAGQSSGESTIPAAVTTGRSSPDVDLNVLVTDKHGAPQNIDKRAFQLFEDGSERPLRFANAEDSPVSLALLVDSSGSIFTRKPEIVSAVTTLIHALPADSEVMGVLFSQEAYIDLPLTPVSKVDLAFVERLDGKGRTALWDALVATDNHLVANAKYAHRAIVVLSDGEDNVSVLNGEQALRLIEHSGAPTIYLCRVSVKAGILNSQARADSFRGHRSLKLIAQWGGGMVLNLDPDPASSVAQIVTAISSQHVLRFTPVDPARNGKRHKIEVRLAVKDVKIHSLPGYYAPAK